jgi:Pentapeptide repeats (8 copies)
VKRSLRRLFVLNQPVIVLVVLLVLAVTLLMSFLLQSRAESGALSPIAAGTSAKEQREVDKLNAEIKQIRSDTGGSLFWLKMAGLFVTLGAAVGGYLIGQAKVTKDRLDFEHRQSVDNTYHALIQELSVEPPLLRVASAMRLGKLLQAPPVEWRVSDARRHELSQLTKQVLAASLAIEKDEKVLKALTIALGLHAEESEHADLRELDLSGAKAKDAYWARIDFRYADFYGADLTDASLRKAILDGAQFRQTVLANAVLAEASCEGGRSSSRISAARISTARSSAVRPSRTFACSARPSSAPRSATTPPASSTSLRTETSPPRCRSASGSLRGLRPPR